MKDSDIENENVENSIVEGLVNKYEAEPTTYLASSQKLMDSSSKKLSREEMDEIFKEKSKYYPQLKEVETSIRHKVVIITPEFARDMLRFSRRGAINPELKNRKINSAAVKRYVSSLNNRKWCLTGEPIIMGDDGEVQDGHTRLEAASRSNVGFIAVLIWGVSDSLSFAHIDVGNIRSRAQVLEMSGVKVDANILSKVAMLAKAFEKTFNPFAFRGTQGTSFQQAEILHYVEENQELALSVDFVSKLAKKHRQEIQASQPTYAFAHYLIKAFMQEYNESLSISPELYLTRVISGIGLQSENDIEYQVRNYLQTLVGESTSYSLICRLSAIFKGWNQYLSLPIYGNKISVRRVAKYTKDEDGNRLPAKGAGNINEPFTVPFKDRGKIPKHIQQQANAKIV